MLTEAEQLELSKLVSQLAPVAAAPPAAQEYAAFRLIVSVGELSVTAGSAETLPPPWRALVQALQAVEKRLMRPSPKQR